MTKLEQLLADIRSCNIRVTLNDPDVDPNMMMQDGKTRPACYLDHLGYHISIPDRYCHKDEHIIALLKHEIAHVWRGDLITMMEEKDTIDPMRANIAMDAIINKALPELAEVVADVGEGYIYIEKLHEDYPDVPLNAMGWRQVYEALPESAEHQLMDILKTLVKLDPKDAKIKHLITIGKLTSLSGRFGFDDIPKRNEVRAKPYDPRINDLLRLTRYVDSMRGASLRIHHRTWSRPGRLPYLRGQTRLWRKHIAVALDMSGSMSQYHSLLLACAKAIARTTQCTLILYSDDILWQGTADKLPSDLSKMGGGTAIRPVLDAARRIRPDLLIIATDAEHESISLRDLPPCPLMWALTGDRGRPLCRLPQDKTVSIFRGK